jgi:LuxR family maltose regulon positive regulatory protein
MSQGKLRRAAETFRDALATGERYTRRTGHRLPVSGYAHSFLAAILCEWNQLDAALEHVQQGIELCERWGEPELLVGGYACLAEIRLVADDAGGALDASQKAEEIAQDLSSFYHARAARGAALVRLRAGDKVGAFRWAADHESLPLPGDSLQDCASGLALAEIRLAQDRPVEALELATKALGVVRDAGTDLMVINALILQALAHQALKETELALQALAKAISIAEREKFVRIFLVQGAPMIQLLRVARKAELAPDYVALLLAARQREGAPEAKPSPGETLVEALSERELEVLRLLAAGLSNREIAQELYISVNTIKTHAKSIYGKLAVNRRTQAVSRARELGLL